MATVKDTIEAAFDRAVEPGVERAEERGTVSERLWPSVNDQWMPNVAPPSAAPPEHAKIIETIWRSGDVDPDGTQRAARAAKLRKFWHFPTWPADAYATAALLLERAGTYTALQAHYFESEPLETIRKRRRERKNPDGYQFRWGYVGRYNRDFPHDANRMCEADRRKTSPLPGSAARTEPCPTDADNQAVRNYAKKHGFRLPPIEPGQWAADFLDPFGILGENQLEMRLAGGMWAFGMLCLVNDEPEGIDKYRYLDPLDRKRFDALDPTFDEKDVGRTLGLLNEKLEACFRFLDDRYAMTAARHWHEIADEVTAGYSLLCKERISEFHAGSDLKAADLKTMFTSASTANRLAVADAHISHLYNRLADIGAWYRKLETKEEKKRVRELAGFDKKDPDAPRKFNRLILLTKWAIDYIQARWTYLLTATDEVSSSLEVINGRAPPDWCAPAFRLMLTADEAAATVGFGTIVDAQGMPEFSTITPMKTLYRTRKEQLRAKGDPKPDFSQIEKISDWAHGKRELWDRTITVTFGHDHGAVLPKARTSQVGCTLRSFSHNLAFLPTRGRVRGRWLVESRKYKRQNLKSTVELLLLPFPFAVRSSCFQGQSAAGEATDHSVNWGWFNVEQKWLEPIGKVGVRRKGVDHASSASTAPPKPTTGLPALIELIRAAVDVKLDGVVLPEFALDDLNYCELATYLYRHTETRFLVTGAGLRPIDQLDGTENPHLQNSVVIACDPEDSVDASRTGDWPVEWARRKHHRWKLDARQLKRYAISHRLDPNKVWWEDLEVRSREIGIVEFHPGSIFTALICEDLARIEPAQVAIRAIGPNLVFVLLMDAAQHPTRWSNQYAGVLADDPGCSVLTISCMGMINRANASEGSRHRNFALWRDSSNLQEISLPEGYHAVNITLNREHVREQTLDGRRDSGKSAAEWKLAGVNPIKIKSEDFRRAGLELFRLECDEITGRETSKPIELKEFLAAFGYEG
jgi:hypothetical protein